jgi:chromosome segregation protein
LHLKSLTLKGFKSFADRVPMHLEPGVTVIVGPNGSGKSNVTDAVLWVLGEQSAKSLRGNAMEDVIFAGSSARQAVGIAEVDLTLDNSDGSLALEFGEVTITRRMYRSGESEYLINNSPCRLMDVHDLLHDSGLGRDTHSIISQGRLDELLNSRPEERRGLIEEAAGVLKHKKRKERALRKLTGMDTNLERARLVLGEIERQLRPLQRQADKAKQAEALGADLRELEVSLAVADLRELQGQWESLLKREREQDAEVELARYRLAEKERELGSFQSLLEEKGLFVGDLSEQRRRLQAVLERLNASWRRRARTWSSDCRSCARRSMSTRRVVPAGRRSSPPFRRSARPPMRSSRPTTRASASSGARPRLRARSVWPPRKSSGP